MSQIILLIQTYGVLIVFGTVLLEQIGLPIPAMPILIVAGALAAGGEISWPACLAASLAACLISDYFWFRAGRFYGKRVLRLLCKISLSPDYCVSQTEDKFRRFGCEVADRRQVHPRLQHGGAAAGRRDGHQHAALPRLQRRRRPAVERRRHRRSAPGSTTASTKCSTCSTRWAAPRWPACSALLALFVLYKYVERRRFLGSLPVERIQVDELRNLIDGGQAPLIIDARSLTAQQLEQAIPGALNFQSCEPGQLMASLDKDRHIVVYCSCPNDVTAAQVARQFLANGFHRARALHGGLDAWNAHHAHAQCREHGPTSARLSRAVNAGRRAECRRVIRET